jgi:hypothetical protein
VTARPFGKGKLVARRTVEGEEGNVMGLELFGDAVALGKKFCISAEF